MESRDFVRDMDMKRDRFSIFVTASDRSKNAAEMPLAVQPGRTSICINYVCEWLFRYSAIWNLTAKQEKYNWAQNDSLRLASRFVQSITQQEQLNSLPTTN